MNNRISASVMKRIATNTALDWFDSPHEFADEANRRCSTRTPYRNSTEGGWYGDDNWNETVANVSKGWPHIVDAAEKIISDVEREGLLSLGWRGYQASVAGAFPLVPAAIIGAPESMFDRAEAREENSTIRVFVDVSVSQIVTTKAIVSRGTAIAAFVLGLAARRPVELYAFAGLDGLKRDSGGDGQFGGGYNVGFASPVVRIDTRPMDLSAVSYCLASPGFYRRLCMAWASLHGFAGGWSYGLYPGDHEVERQAALRLALGLERQDVLIPAELREGQISKDPVSWVRDMLTEHIIENVNVD
jgi:hypothetical protein